jgi:integrase
MPCIPIKETNKLKEMMEVLATKQNGFVYALYMEFALTTALRVSDILALRKKDIKNGIVYVKTQKTKKQHYIALNDKCRQALESYLEYKKDDDLIFDFSRQWVHQFIKWAADQVGLDKNLVSCHTTRKSAAWRFYVQSKYDIMKTSEFLGHKSFSETRKYLGISQDEVNKINTSYSW